jgi:hypothetical protein
VIENNDFTVLNPRRAKYCDQGRIAAKQHLSDVRIFNIGVRMLQAKDDGFFLQIPQIHFGALPAADCQQLTIGRKVDGSKRRISSRSWSIDFYSQMNLGARLIRRAHDQAFDNELQRRSELSHAFVLFPDRPSVRSQAETPNSHQADCRQ